MENKKIVSGLKTNVTMKNILRFLVIAIGCMFLVDSVLAEEVHKFSTKSSGTVKETAAGCQSGSGQRYLDINNVRAICYSYGNGWFLENAEYEIPKGSAKTSMFSFSLWIGGIDVNNNLKLAAYRYGQGANTPQSHTQNDFWPGPLTVDGTASIDAETCAQYDKLFPITRTEVQEYLAWWDNRAAYPDYTIPKSILEWPAHGDAAKGQAWYLAPYMDVSNTGEYNPQQGDYPYYDLSNKLCKTFLKPGELVARAHLRNGEPDDTLGILGDQVLKGDQTLWSVYNDKGNRHSETLGEPIGMEIRAQYFAFATNDAINDMTFYSYELVNRSTYTLTGTYFSQWVDPDLGYSNDDYVGCDVARGLGYCYNGRPVDGTGQNYAYGASPPAVGVDFFQGPYMDPDYRDNPEFTGANCDEVFNGEHPLDSNAINGVNFGDGIIDNERYGMRRFVYHNNSNSGVPDYMQDPNYAPEYYLFLRGIWKDNQKMQYGGNAHFGQGAAYGPECDFMFPDETDPCDWGTGGRPPNGPKKWTEVTAGNPPEDRRFMQSAGPFRLLPGACNYVTVGIPWARTVSGTAWDAVELLKIVDDKCQKLFNNCFAVLNGPNAPDLTIEEMDKQLILYISNRKSNDKGNNFQEKYQEYDPSIIIPVGVTPDTLYRFEGYQIFQLKDANVSASDLRDPSKARLVAQCDIKNGVTKLVNWVLDPDLNANKGTVMVDGADQGIRHSFVITEDKFAESQSKTLVNHKQYYYMAIAYAYNNFKQYSNLYPNMLDGQQVPYLSGRSGSGGGAIKKYTAIPHIPVGEVTRSTYGEGPVITRHQGQGNGGMIIDFDQATIDLILSKPPVDSLNVYGGPDYPIAYRPTYLVSRGPVDIKVVDPLNVVSGEYTVKLDSMVKGPAGSPIADTNVLYGKWSLVDNQTHQVYYSDTTTIFPYEQLFLDLGLSITIAQPAYPGGKVSGAVTEDNGLIWAPAAFYQDINRVWLDGVTDNDIPLSVFNWIRSGTYKSNLNSIANDWNMDPVIENADPWDPNKDYQQIQSGQWAPYAMCAVGPSMAFETQNPMGAAYSKESKKLDRLKHLASVDIVLTTNPAHWTRCPVLEMCSDSMLAEGRVRRFDPRKAPSVNVEGQAGISSTNPLYNSNYISSTGMGWFPGYAINLETGERLNIVFGENSWLAADNGRDMIFNPSSRLIDAIGNPVFGGQHYIYVFDHRIIDGEKLVRTFEFPAYDGGAYLFARLSEKLDNERNMVYMREYMFSAALYTSIPLSVQNQAWLSNDVTIKIRVAKPYNRYYSVPMPAGSIDSTGNRFYPVYTFNTSVISTTKYNQEKASSDLDLINVVPNPYYAYDDYERNQLDNRIKIVNLPTKCQITIFDMSGTLIRQFNVDKSGIPQPRSSTAGLDTDAKTSIDWDLKNFAGIPIAGGIYLIHVKADGLGERTIKWFGILRPVDLNSL